eukprot:TRINITY_DN13405_c0_g1_i1.p1 TRINITY_DN13405_c0_g1~~TRINITY_DN13405_c0_g1_i1.p1  ORF type:complete len:887 (+),score=229.50 TRINITY_DN13405_c0_g1_i1:80-2740(+)
MSLQKTTSSKPPKLVWGQDSNLLIFVIKGESLGAGAPKLEPFLKIKSQGKSIYKTQPIKSSDPLWERYYYSNSVPSSLLFSVHDERSGNNLGLCTLNLTNLTEEIVHEFRLKLEPHKEKYRSKISGTILIRILISNSPELRELSKSSESEYYFYEEYLEKFKTGDLILFSGRTVLDATLKLRTGQPYSHVGIILKISNPLTHHNQLYVVECTRNVDKIIDAWHQGIVNGISVFRLEERLHQFNGSAIWWLPLKEQMSIPQEQMMLRWIAHMHYRQSHYGTGLINPCIPPSFGEFLRNFNINFKYPTSMTELWGPIFILLALEAARLVTGPAEEGDPNVVSGDIGKNAQGTVVWSCFVKKVWMPYPQVVADKLEEQYKKGDTSCKIDNLLANGDCYFIDFLTWKQINEVSKHERDIKREVNTNAPVAVAKKETHQVLVEPESKALNTTISSVALKPELINPAYGHITGVPHNFSSEEKKNLTPPALLSLSVYDTNPILLFCMGCCLKHYGENLDHSKAHLKQFSALPGSIFTVSPDWDKPFQFTQQIEKEEIKRKKRVEEMVKQETEAIQQLDDDESGSELWLGFFEEGDATSEEMQKDATTQAEEAKLEEDQKNGEPEGTESLNNSSVSVQETPASPSDLKLPEYLPGEKELLSTPTVVPKSERSHRHSHHHANSDPHKKRGSSTRGHKKPKKSKNKSEEEEHRHKKDKEQKGTEKKEQTQENKQPEPDKKTEEKQLDPEHEKKEEIKEETKQEVTPEEIKQQETKPEETKQPELKQETTDGNKQETTDGQQEQLKQEETKQEPMTEDIKQQDAKPEETKQPEPKEETKQDAVPEDTKQLEQIQETKQDPPTQQPEKQPEPEEPQSPYKENLSPSDIIFVDYSTNK